MKKLFMLCLTILLFSQCREKVICYNISASNSKTGSVEVCYRKNEYVLNFPDDPEERRAWEYALIKAKYEKLRTCPCNSTLQLWGSVELAPDGQEPPPPPPKKGGSGNIAKNYLMMDKNLPFLPSSSPVKLNYRYPQITPVPTNYTVVNIAIIDSGLELTDIENTNSNYLYQSNGQLICRSTTWREGKYGINLLNYTESLNQLEPQDDDGHGTFINGIISSKSERPQEYTGEQYYIGDIPNIHLKLLHMRFVSNRAEDGTLFDALCGIHIALDKKVKVINASWRALANESNLDSLKNAFYPTLKAIKKHDAILVASSGNDSLGHSDRPNVNDPNYVHVFPASFSRDPEYQNNVIAVGAWDLKDKLGGVASFSNMGDYIDIYAPGVGITSSYLRNNTYNGKAIGQGTSYATPYVTRVVAILLGMGVPSEDIKRRIIDNAQEPQNNINIKLLHHAQAIENRNR